MLSKSVFSARMSIESIIMLLAILLFEVLCSNIIHTPNLGYLTCIIY